MMDFCPKKGKFFIFILGQYFSFFWIFVLSHIWLPRYEKTADFLAQMLFGSCIGSHWFQKLKNIQSDTQYLCKIPDIFSVSQPKCLLLCSRVIWKVGSDKRQMDFENQNVDLKWKSYKSKVLWKRKNIVVQFVFFQKEKWFWNSQALLFSKIIHKHK